MRIAAPRLRSLLCLVVVATSWAAPPGAHGQPVTTVARAGWRVGGNVNATARLGNVLYLGGNFRGVAPEGNVAAGVLAVDATSGLPGPAAKLNGNVLAIEPDGAGGWYVGGNFVEAVIGGTPQPRVRLVHLLPNGDLDPAFTASADGGPVRALEFVPGVGLFVGGDFTGLNGSSRNRVGLVESRDRRATGLELLGHRCGLRRRADGARPRLRQRRAAHRRRLRHGGHHDAHQPRGRERHC